MRISVLLIVAIVLSVPVTAAAQGLSWYAGVDAGASSLRPETENSPFTVDSSTSFGAGVFVGYDFSQRISIELGFNFLGSAMLSSDTGTTDVSYSSLSAGGLFYVFGNSGDIAERNGFAGYLRLGVSAMDNTTSPRIPLDREDNVAILAGAGVEWPMSRQLNLRGELTSFDGDAQVARVAVVYRPRTGAARNTPVARVPQTRPLPQAPTTPEPVVTPAPVDTPETVVPVQPSVAAPVTPATQSNCSAPVGAEPADAQGCALFSGVLRGVEFTNGTAALTPAASQLLNRLAQNLLSHPTVSIEIQAHTESFGGEAAAREIARQRTLSVARYLAGRGVPVRSLRARAFGHSRPLASDNSAAGRRQNNRIELRVLQ